MEYPLTGNKSVSAKLRRRLKVVQSISKVPLLPSDHISKGTLILVGTGVGVFFKPINIWGQQFYLQAGDVVRTQATYLGRLTNRIE